MPTRVGCTVRRCWLCPVSNAPSPSFTPRCTQNFTFNICGVTAKKCLPQGYLERYQYAPVIQRWDQVPACNLTDVTNTTRCWNAVDQIWECCTEPCEIVGVGTRRFTAGLQQQVHKLGLADAVGFGPALPAPQLAERMRRADVVAVPSSSETFGLVALEAQACGTPVLATDVDWLRTAVLDGVTGRLVPDRDPASWAHALLGLGRDPETLARMGAAAARRAREHSWERTALATAEVYARVRDRVRVRHGSRRRVPTLER